jgi:hypothetical protein
MVFIYAMGRCRDGLCISIRKLLSVLEGKEMAIKIIPGLVRLPRTATLRQVCEVLEKDGGVSM